MDSQEIVARAMNMLTEASKAVAILAIGQRIVDAQSETERAFLAQALERLTTFQRPQPNNFGQEFNDPQYQSDMFNHQM
jgi:hypothetical protein